MVNIGNHTKIPDILHSVQIYIILPLGAEEIKPPAKYCKLFTASFVVSKTIRCIKVV
jgi:hypothetical protein